jgi:predicted dienelactone hydrolase
LKKFLIVLLVLLVGLIGGAIYVVNPRLPPPDGAQSAELNQPGKFGIATEAIRLVDASRPTPPNGEFEGTPNRMLDGRIWYPRESSEGPFPLIVYSHGFMSSVAEATYLVNFLVPKGYVVAAVNYPLSNGSAPGGPTVLDVINQPGDLSYLIDDMLARNLDQSDSLYGLIDPSQVAAVGLSLGGLTTKLAAYHRDMRDPRLQAAVSIAGPSSFLLREFFQTTGLPFMMVAGSDDAVVPYAANALPILDKIDNALLVTLEAASHTGFAAEAARYFRWARHPDRLVCRLLRDSVSEEELDQPRVMVAPDPAVGISDTGVPGCTRQEYERAMRPAKQQVLTRLAIYAFLESQFASDLNRRHRMSRYLEVVMAEENPEIRIQAGALGFGAGFGAGAGANH